MDEVDDHAHVEVAGVCFGFDPGDLVVIAVHERDPVVLVVGIAALSLVEDLRDDAGGVIDDARGQPFAVRDRAVAGGLFWVAGGEDVGGGA